MEWQQHVFTNTSNTKYRIQAVKNQSRSTELQHHINVNEGFYIKIRSIKACWAFSTRHSKMYWK